MRDTVGGDGAVLVTEGQAEAASFGPDASAREHARLLSSGSGRLNTNAAEGAEGQTVVSLHSGGKVELQTGFRAGEPVARNSLSGGKSGFRIGESVKGIFKGLYIRCCCYSSSPSNDFSRQGHEPIGRWSVADAARNARNAHRKCVQSTHNGASVVILHTHTALAADAETLCRGHTARQHQSCGSKDTSWNRS